MATPATSKPLLSVIIPVLNEAAHLPTLLSNLKAQQNIALELIVSDGGSSDGSAALAEAAGAVLIKAPCGRGAQMNAGAYRARGDYLLFLHADSELLDITLLSRAVQALAAAMSRYGHRRMAGHFQLRFKRGRPGNRLAYRYMEEKTALNRPYTTNGDQGMLLRSSFFRELDGFDPSLPFLEDQRLAEKIRACGLWITLPGVLQTSARRFESEGFYRRYILMGIIMCMHYADIQEFFQQAPQVYRAQHETKRLLLAPFFCLIWRLSRDRGLKQSLQDGLRIGRFIGRNIWQIGFFLDVLARPLWGPGRYPLMALYERLCRCWFR